jgi:hypothetical protein
VAKVTLSKDLESEAQSVAAEQEVDIYRARFMVALRHGLIAGDVVELDEKGQAITPAEKSAA